MSWLVNEYRYRKMLYFIYKPPNPFTWKSICQYKPWFVNSIYKPCSLKYKPSKFLMGLTVAHHAFWWNYRVHSINNKNTQTGQELHCGGVGK